MSSGGLSAEALAPIRAGFFQECEELLGDLEAGLTGLRDGAWESATVDSVFRAVHSIKGGAGAFGLDRLVRFAHAFETAMDAVRAAGAAPDTEVIRLLLAASDVLADLVRASRDNAEAEAQGLLDGASALIDGLEALAPPRSATPVDDFGFLFF
jgi:two-component system chemotaxis sensor kinase CheA